MPRPHHLPKQLMGHGFMRRLVAYVFILALLANLGAIVDALHHPEIPYFDEEHLVVGGTTCAVITLLLCLLELYLYRLRQALDRLNRLENFLAICSFCRKVRVPGADPQNRDAWLSLETYLHRQGTTQFSHGLCPDCFAENYGDVVPGPTS